MTETGAPRVLVVDDDWMNREVMQAYLARYGFQVMVAYDANSAYEAAHSFKPNLILLDVRLGEKDGFEVCFELRAREETRQTPIVMFSALATDDARARAHAVGATTFLAKTMNLSYMVAQIRELLGLPPDPNP